MLTATAYAVVRMVEAYKGWPSREWIDYSTAACLPDIAMENAERDNKLIPEWAKSNPIVRVAKTTITEEIV